MPREECGMLWYPSGFHGLHDMLSGACLLSLGSFPVVASSDLKEVFRMPFTMVNMIPLILPVSYVARR